MTDISFWRPILTALILPPVPLILLMLIGSRLRAMRNVYGLLFVWLAAVLLWLSACQGVGRWLQTYALGVPPPIRTGVLEDVRADAKAKPSPTVAIVVLGGGRVPKAREIGVADLQDASLERLRYGIQLSRETGAPVAYTGGVGWSQVNDGGMAEADAAARIAEKEFLRPLRWVESHARDTRENAILTVNMLKSAGIQRIVLVTHAWHMRRAQRAFEQAAGAQMQINAAPMGYFEPTERTVLDWMPSLEGFAQVRLTLRELIALAMNR